MSVSLTAKTTRILSLVVALILVLLPFHAFLSVWTSSLFGHYTLFRLWKEIILTFVGITAIVLLVRDPAMRQSLRKQQLFWLIGAYVLLQLFLGFTSIAHKQVSAKALAYGLLDNLRYLLFFVLVVGIAARDDWLGKHWKQLVLIPAAIVVIFGLLQVFVLPHNFLAHFGYDPQTIPAYGTVNSNSHYIRAQSTLRGANPLGAYLVLIVALLTVLGLRAQVIRDRWLYGVGVLAALIVLFFSYSRGAWAGAALSILIIGFIAITNKALKRWLALVLAIVIVAGAFTAWALRHNTRFENLVFHTSPHTVATTSDQNHNSALRSGLHDLTHDPLGRGPGTAGPASVYNTKAPARIAENYFIQIGQEVGWLGLAIFGFILVVLGIELWQIRTSPLGLTMLATLLGLSLVGMVSFVWADDTLSYAWWGLAAIALAPHLLGQKKHHA